MNNYAKKLVVVGENGNGKSQTCNTLLGKEIFSGADRSRTTGSETCYLRTASVNMWVVDSPGMFDPDSVLAERALEIQKSVKECEDPHAFLIVFKADKLEEDRQTDTLEMLRLIFGDVFFKHAIIVITNSDKFQSDAEFESVKQQEHMRRIIALCHGRIAKLENNATPQSKRQMIDKIFGLVDQVSRMGHACYQNKELHIHKTMLEHHLKYVDVEKPVKEQIKEMKLYLEKEKKVQEKDAEYDYPY